MHEFIVNTFIMNNNFFGMTFIQLCTTHSMGMQKKKEKKKPNQTDKQKILILYFGAGL